VSSLREYVACSPFLTLCCTLLGLTTLLPASHDARSKDHTYASANEGSKACDQEAPQRCNEGVGNLGSQEGVVAHLEPLTVEAPPAASSEKDGRSSGSEGPRSAHATS
jgi:hypothetical protein